VHPTGPAWYHNLIAAPLARLQDHEQIHLLRAREVHGEEKTRWWQPAEAHWPHFPEYRAKAAGRKSQWWSSNPPTPET